MQGICRRVGLGIGLLLLPLWSWSAPQFSQLYVFGDSLSDTGNTEIVAPGGDVPDTDFTYGTNGRFSNGPVWVEYLNDHLGLGAVAPSRAGGRNYAHGGSEITFDEGPSTGLLRQYQMYASGAGAAGSDPDALYVVWSGSNDIRYSLMAAAADPDTDIAAIFSQRIGAYYQVLSGLAASGAQNLLVPNIANVGRSPEALAAGVSGETTALVMAWNAALDDMLDTLEGQTQATIWRFDAFALVEGIFANAAELGFTHTGEPCSTVVDNVEIPCANPDEYIFWDMLHPTTAGHRLIGEGAWALINDPATEVPTPLTLWLLMPGIAGILMVRRRQHERQRGRDSRPGSACDSAGW